MLLKHITFGNKTLNCGIPRRVKRIADEHKSMIGHGAIWKINPVVGHSLTGKTAFVDYMRACKDNFFSTCDDFEFIAKNGDRINKFSNLEDRKSALDRMVFPQYEPYPEEILPLFERVRECDFLPYDLEDHVDKLIGVKAKVDYIPHPLIELTYFLHLFEGKIVVLDELKLSSRYLHIILASLPDIGEYPMRGQLIFFTNKELMLCPHAFNRSQLNIIHENKIVKVTEYQGYSRASKDKIRMSFLRRNI